MGILCHSTEASESHIKGVANIGDKNVLKAKCKGSKFVSTETSKQLDLKKVTCSGNGFDPLVKVDAGMLTPNTTYLNQSLIQTLLFCFYINFGQRVKDRNFLLLNF